MESLLHQSRSLCPFLKKTSPATLRSLSTASRPSSSPGGGTISNLQTIARKCPVMSKALAVQSSRLALGGMRGFSSASRRGVGATNIVKGSMNSNKAAMGMMNSGKKHLHITSIKAAAVDEELHGKQDRGMYCPHLPRFFFLCVLID